MTAPLYCPTALRRAIQRTERALESLREAERANNECDSTASIFVSIARDDLADARTDLNGARGTSPAEWAAKRRAARAEAVMQEAIQ